MKRHLYIALAVFITLIALAAMSVRRIAKSTDIALQYNGITTSVGNFSDLKDFVSGRGAVTLKFLVTLTNGNWFTIPIRDLESRVFYKGQLIGNSSPSALKDIDITPGSVKNWIEPIDIHAKKEIAGDLVREILGGGDPVIEFETELKMFGIRYTYSDRLQIIQTALS